MILQDIIFAAILAFVLTCLIKGISRIIRAISTSSTEFGYGPGDLEVVLQRCYSMFPVDNLWFKGVTFHRGMVVRVITNSNKTIEGKFVGANEHNGMVCFVTNHSVVAHKLGNIEEIQPLAE